MERLPLIIQEIAEEFGLKTAYEFVREFGGEPLFVPKTTRTKKLAHIEEKLLQYLIYHYGGTVIEVPAWQPGSLRDRRVKIARMLAEGRSRREISKATGATIRSISYQKARMEERDEDSPQLDL